MVNGVLQPAHEGAPDFVLNRLRMQADYLDEIQRKFGDQVRALVPQFEREIRGVPMLQRAAEALFA